LLEVDIPGWQRLRLEALVLDVNGTLARDGELLPGVRKRLAALRAHLDVRLLSADTFGRLDTIAAELGVRGERLKHGEHEAPQKARFVHDLGVARVVAVGNGANDVDMLAEAALGIAVLGPEGLAVPALIAADVLASPIDEALELLIATLRR